MGRGLAAFAVALVFFTVDASAARKTIDEYWQDVDLKFDDTLGQALTERTCYQSEKTFLACMSALDTIVGHAPQALTVVPTARLAVVNGVASGFGAVTRELGAVTICGPKRFSSDSAADLYDLNRREKADATRAWLTLHAAAPGTRVPIADVLAWAKAQPFFRGKESLITGRTLNAMLAILRDPHTSYTPAAYMREVVMAPGSDNIVGIGVTLRQITRDGRKYLTVVQPTEGGPALAAGVRARDLITHVGDTSIVDMSLSDASALIRGDRGTTIRLTIRRGSQTLQISIVRAEIRTENVVGRVLDAGPVPLGYVKLRGFMKPRGCEDVEAAVRTAERAGARALVLDLRDNGGGLLTQSVCIANLFLDADKVVVESRALEGAGRQVLRTQNAAKTTLPMVTLINAGSASASEIVSGALQDHRRSFIVGERSYGKATVQQMQTQGALIYSYTMARFYLPSGRTNQIEGVLPDVTAHRSPSPTRDDLVAYREEDIYQALPALGAPWRQPRPAAIGALETCMGRHGRARQRFQAAENAAIPPDYQLLSAEDVATCAVTNRVDPTQAEPMPQYRAAAEPPVTELERRLRDAVQAL